MHYTTLQHQTIISVAGAATSFFVFVFISTNVLSRETRVCRDKHVYITTKHVFCRDKSMLVATKLHDKIMFVMTKRLSRQTFVFVSTKDVSRQAYFCRNKRRVCVFRNKSMLVATKALSRQTRICCNKNILSRQTAFSRHNFCQDKHTFVATKDEFCRDRHVFVATKIILVAASASDTIQAVLPTAFPRTITQPGAN